MKKKEKILAVMLVAMFILFCLPSGTAVAGLLNGNSFTVVTSPPPSIVPSGDPTGPTPGTLALSGYITNVWDTSNSNPRLLKSGFHYVTGYDQYAGSGTIASTVEGPFNEQWGQGTFFSSTISPSADDWSYILNGFFFGQGLYIQAYTVTARTDDYLLFPLTTDTTNYGNIFHIEYPGVYTEDAANITTTSAVLRANTEGYCIDESTNKNYADFGFEYWRAGQPIKSATIVDTGSQSGYITSAITGLQPGTTYDFPRMVRTLTFPVPHQAPTHRFQPMLASTLRSLPQATTVAR